MSKIILIKENSKKIISKDSNLLDSLKKDGWVEDKPEVQKKTRKKKSEK